MSSIVLNSSLNIIEIGAEIVLKIFDLETKPVKREGFWQQGEPEKVHNQDLRNFSH